MNASAELLKQLRIDRDTPPPRARRGWLIAGLALGFALLLALIGWRLGASTAAPLVETASARVLGAGKVASNIWFGGYYQNIRNFFPIFAIGEGYLEFSARLCLPLM